MKASDVFKKIFEKGVKDIRKLENKIKDKSERFYNKHKLEVKKNVSKIVGKS